MGKHFIYVREQEEQVLKNLGQLQGKSVKEMIEASVKSIPQNHSIERLENLILELQSTQKVYLDLMEYLIEESFFLSGAIYGVYGTNQGAMAKAKEYQNDIRTLIEKIKEKHKK
jgi:hypothetical protein